MIISEDDEDGDDDDGDDDDNLLPGGADDLDGGLAFYQTLQLRWAFCGNLMMMLIKIIMMLMVIFE